MKANLKTLLFAASMATATMASAGTPITHIMPCCRVMNNGTRFLVDHAWRSGHDYTDMNQCRDILQKIKDAGINIVSIDFTNPSMWDVPYWDNGHQGENYDAIHQPMLENIVTACGEMDMKFLLFLGNTGAWTMKYWNEVAQIVWEKYASLPSYAHYGYGDDRPMMIIFMPGSDFAAQWNATPENEKDYLAKFRIGTCQVNDPLNPVVATDGWGYRNYSESSDSKVRFCSPNGGVAPQEWYRVDAEEWERRLDWALEASEYTVIGSYDDSCDGIFWGIANTSTSFSDYHRNASTVNDPYAYYNPVKARLTGSTGLDAVGVSSELCSVEGNTVTALVPITVYTVDGREAASLEAGQQAALAGNVYLVKGAGKTGKIVVSAL